MCNVELIRQLANSKGMSLSSLEQAVGLGNGTIGKWKKQSPSCDKLKLVADYLSVTLDYLMADKEQLPSSISPTIQLSTDQQTLLYNYNDLHEPQKKLVLQFISNLLLAQSPADTTSVSDPVLPTATILDQKKHLA